MSSGQVFEQLARQDERIVRVISKGKQQHRGAQLLPDRCTMVQITAVYHVAVQSGGFQGSIDVPVGLASQADAQPGRECRVCSALFGQHLPEDVRIAIHREKTGMNQVEKAVRLNRLGKIFGIVAVGNHGYGRMRPRGISLLHQRRDREHGRCVVQHALLQPMMPPFHAGQEGHPLEPVHLGPRVAEIRNPGDAEQAVQALANEVQRLRGTGGNDHIHRMFPQVFF